MAEMTNIDINEFDIVQGVEDNDYVVLSRSDGSSGRILLGLFRKSASSTIAPSIKDGMWWIGDLSTGVQAKGDTPLLRLTAEGIEYKYTLEDDSDWQLLVPISDIRLDYEDLTESEIAELQRPATEALERMEATEASLKTAEELRVAAETARVTAETARAEAETERATAETARASTEEKRVTAETARVASDTARTTAETARASAESKRVTAESARVTAESARVAAESSRVTAEKNRVSAESARVTAENARKNAESSRVSAEVKREQAYISMMELTATADAAAKAATAAVEDATAVVERVENISLELEDEAVRKTPQTLSQEEQAQARSNIGAVSAAEVENSIDTELLNYYTRTESDELFLTYEKEEETIEDVSETLVTEALRKTPQTLTQKEQAQARTNIGAVSMDEVNEEYESVLLGRATGSPADILN